MNVGRKEKDEDGREFQLEGSRSVLQLLQVRLFESPEL